MPTFLVLQNSYEAIDIALFERDNLIDHMHDTQLRASKDLVPYAQQLLQRNNLSLHDLAFIAVNQGPGPFTTLRVTIASANGVSFGSKVPLVGVDGLQALLDEYSLPQHPVSVALLNAFANDVYFGIKTTRTQQVTTGYENHATCIARLARLYPNQLIHFMGGGALMYQDLIVNTFGTYALFATPLPTYCSINAVAKAAHAQWEQGNQGSNQLLPLYLKEQMFVKSM